MGDKLHKASPPDDAEEIVIEPFRVAARRQLELNKLANENGERKFGDEGYLTENRSELADKIGTDKTMINRIIGPARDGSQVRYVETSAFVGRIRDELRLPAVVKMTITATPLQAALIRRLLELPDDALGVIERSIDKRK